MSTASLICFESVERPQPESAGPRCSNPGSGLRSGLPGSNHSASTERHQLRLLIDGLYGDNESLSFESTEAYPKVLNCAKMLTMDVVSILISRAPSESNMCAAMTRSVRIDRPSCDARLPAAGTEIRERALERLMRLPAEGLTSVQSVAESDEGVLQSGMRVRRRSKLPRKRVGKGVTLLTPVSPLRKVLWALVRIAM